MKSLHSLLLLLAVSIAVFSGALAIPPITTHTAVPDRLEIMRTVGRSSHTSAHEMIIQPRSVQNLYTHMLALPVAPTDQICPQYIIANYQLTFYSHNIIVQKANALKGECQPVTLGHDDVRTADGEFWGLINNALAVGMNISTPVATPTPTPTPKSRKPPF